MTIVICDKCREAAAQESFWIEGRKRDLCSLCALAYAAGAWLVPVGLPKETR